MNDALVISNVLLWVLVLVLGIVVVALTRQIGLLHERIAPLGALAMQQGPAVGEAAPHFDLPTLSGGPVSIGAGERTLLFFLSPTCPVCETLLPTLRRVVADESVRLVLASDGEREEHLDYVRSHGLEDVDYLLSMELGLAFAVAKLPTAVLIDEDGIVRAKGIVNTREHLESLFNADELGVASLQEHRDRNLKVVS
jgi:methylamine dehydrogenase accessory protein MauD